jgi:hypothetical protein
MGDPPNETRILSDSIHTKLPQQKQCKIFSCIPMICKKSQNTFFKNVLLMFKFKFNFASKKEAVWLSWKHTHLRIQRSAVWILALTDKKIIVISFVRNSNLVGEKMEIWIWKKPTCFRSSCRLVQWNKNCQFGSYTNL